KVYPTGNVQPANLLKFHIYFSQPMRGGQDIFKQIEILDDKGNPIHDAWLTDEIWDETGQVLIIYIHPGRIKWGVVLREVFGHVLYPDRDYTLVIREGMLDANGQKLGKDYTKKFRTIAEDRVRIDLSGWKFGDTSPKVGTRDSIRLNLPKSIDHKSLVKFLTVVDAKGQRVGGGAVVGKDEKSWVFTPNHPWTNQKHQVKIDGQMEDVAGNTPMRPFDLDLTAPKLAPQRLELGFSPWRPW